MEISNILIDKNRKDSRLHGSYEFPMATYKVKFEMFLRGFINWHWHEEMQFHIVKKGKIAFYVN